MAAVRDPDVTRQNILTVTSEEMRRNGYKATGLADIIKKAKISKGALYHHFKNKQELGYAVFEEVFMEEFLSFAKALLTGPDPLASFYDHLDVIPDMFTDEQLECGCPINSLSQEMSADDEGFRVRTLSMYEQKQKLFAEAIRTSKNNNKIREDVDEEAVALFIVSNMQGLSSMAKVSRDRVMVEKITQSLKGYINSLRVTPN